MLPWGSVAAEQWLTDRFNALATLTAYVGESIVNDDELPEDEELPALFFYRSTAMDTVPVGNQAPVVAEDLRYVVELLAEGESYADLIAPATAFHDAIHRQRGQLLGCLVSCERTGELPGSNKFTENGRPFIKLGGIYQVVVTNAGG